MTPFLVRFFFFQGPKAPRRRKQGISNQGTAPYNAPASIVPPASELDVVKESPRRSTRSTDPQPSSFSNTYNTRAFKLSAPARKHMLNSSFKTLSSVEITLLTPLISVLAAAQNFSAILLAIQIRGK